MPVTYSHNHSRKSEGMQYWKIVIHFYWELGPTRKHSSRQTLTLLRFHLIVTTGQPRHLHPYHWRIALFLQTNHISILISHSSSTRCVLVSSVDVEARIHSNNSHRTINYKPRDLYPSTALNHFAHLARRKRVRLKLPKFKLLQRG